MPTAAERSALEKIAGELEKISVCVSGLTAEAMDARAAYAYRLITDDILTAKKKIEAILKS